MLFICTWLIIDVINSCLLHKKFDIKFKILGRKEYTPSFETLILIYVLRLILNSEKCWESKYSNNNTDKITMMVVVMVVSLLNELYPCLYLSCD
jgi:hypothetical protein